MKDCSYQCCKCRRRWQGKPGMLKDGCIFCGHLYVKWINYERWWRSRKRSQEYRRIYPLGDD